jgi:large subunit ribosomal protein L10
MLNKTQKKEHVAESAKLIAGSKSLVFADFSGSPTKEIEKLKLELKKAGATYKVFKKRLLKIALTEANIPTEMLDVKAPAVTVFAKGDLTTVAGAIYKFSKELAKKKIDFKVLGGFDRELAKPVTVAEFNVIARLPSREVLLAQVIGTMSGPLRKFMIALQEIAKKKSEGAPATPVAAVATPAAEAAAPAVQA